MSSQSLRIIFELYPEAAGNHPILNWLEQAGWCHAIEVQPEVSGEVIADLRRRGWQVALNLPAHPATRQFHWTRIAPDG